MPDALAHWLVGDGPLAFCLGMFLGVVLTLYFALREPR
jgi:hypothetical protein